MSWVRLTQGEKGPPPLFGAGQRCHPALVRCAAVKGADAPGKFTQGPTRPAAALPSHMLLALLSSLP